MKPRKKLLLASVAVLALGMSTTVNAETVTTKTVVSQKEMSNVKEINFSAFDVNNDGILSMAEVGEKLFYLFDTDGNEVIDNIEYNNKNVMTIIPMEKQTFTFVDYNNDGIADDKTYTYETFIQQSRLMRFDKNMDGLSPEEFIGDSFLKLDDDKSKAIELEEWKEGYLVSVRPPVAEQERYSQ